MSIEVKRKGNETTEGLIRRFREKILRSRILVNAKKSRFRDKKKSPRQVKKDALVRKKNREKRDYLIKSGKIIEMPKNEFRRRR